MVTLGGGAASHEQGSPVPPKVADAVEERITKGHQIHLTERINYIVSRKSIHAQTRQLNLITRNSKVELTGLWVS
jgi:hypothetical protein